MTNLLIVLLTRLQSPSSTLFLGLLWIVSLFYPFTCRYLRGACKSFPTVSFPLKSLTHGTKKFYLWFKTPIFLMSFSSPLQHFWLNYTNVAKTKQSKFVYWLFYTKTVNNFFFFVDILNRLFYTIYLSKRFFFLFFFFLFSGT